MTQNYSHSFNWRREEFNPHHWRKRIIKNNNNIIEIINYYNLILLYFLFIFFLILPIVIVNSKRVKKIKHETTTNHYYIIIWHTWSWRKQFVFFFPMFILIRAPVFRCSPVQSLSLFSSTSANGYPCQFVSDRSLGGQTHGLGR